MCDECNRIIARKKCDICNKDICNECELNFNMDINLVDKVDSYGHPKNRDRYNSISMKAVSTIVGQLIIGEISICQNCTKNIVKLISKKDKEKIFTKQIVDYFRNELAIEELKK